MLATTGTSFQGSFGSFSLTKDSTPSFCRPTALSMPQGVSATRGVGLPGRGWRERPLTTMPPREARSP